MNDEYAELRHKLAALKRERAQLLRERSHKRFGDLTKYYVPHRTSTGKNNILERRKRRVAKRGPFNAPKPTCGHARHYFANDICYPPFRAPGWLVSHSGMILARGWNNKVAHASE